MSPILIELEQGVLNKTTIQREHVPKITIERMKMMNRQQ